MSTVPAVDVSWMSELGQNLANAQAQNAAPGILAGLTGETAPPQPQGFFSSLFGSQPAQPSLAAAANQNQQSAYIPDVQKGQLPTPNPAVSPQVAQAAAGKGLTAGQADSYASLRSIGLPHSGASALIANLSGESGANLNPGALNSKDPGGVLADGAYGIGQWTAGRQTGLLNFARNQGTDPSNRDTQLQFAAWELKNKYPSLWSQLNDPNSDPHDNLRRLVNEYEVPADKTGAIAQRSRYLGAPYPQVSQPMMAGAGPVQPGASVQLAGPVPTPNAQAPALTVPGYEAAGPVTRAQAAAAPENDARMPGTDEWDAAAAKGVPSVNMAGAQVPQTAQAMPSSQGVGVPQAQAAIPARLNMTPPPVAANGVPTVGSAAPTPSGQRFVPSLAVINQAINNPLTHNAGVMYMQMYAQQQQMQQQIQKEQQMALFNHALGQGRIIPEAERQAAGLPTGVYFQAKDGEIKPVTGTQEQKENIPASIQEWKFGRNNPDFARAPKWVPNATINELGQPQGGWVSPPNPAQMAPGAGQAGGQTSPPPATQEQIQKEVGLPDNTKPDNGPSPTLAPEVMQRLQAIPPMRRPIVQAILEGRLPLPKVTSRGGLPVLLNADVTAIDPSFDTTTADARKATRIDFVRGGPSSSKAQIQAGGTGINHLSQLIALSDAIPDFSNIPGVPGPLSQEWGTWAANKLSNADNKAIQNMRGTADAFAGELVKYLTGSEGTQEQRHAFAARIDPSLPAATRKQQILDFTDVIEGRRSELQAAWHNGMGPYVSDFPVLSATSQKSLDRVKTWAGGGAAPQPSSQGQEGMRLPNGVTLPPGKTLAGVVQDTRDALKTGAITPEIAARALQRFGLDPSRVAPAQ